MFVRTRNDVEAAVFQGRIVNGGPGCDAGGGSGHKVKIVLVHPLAFCAGRLVVIHGLRAQGGLAQEELQHVGHVGIGQPGHGPLAVAMRMHGPHLALGRINFLVA